MPVESIYRLIRASSEPFSGAFSTIEGDTRIVIWEAEPFEYKSAYSAVPGQVLFSDGKDPIIACGDGVIKLIRVSSSVDECHDMKALIIKSLRNRLV